MSNGLIFYHYPFHKVQTKSCVPGLRFISRYKISCRAYVYGLYVIRLRSYKIHFTMFISISHIKICGFPMAIFLHISFIEEVLFEITVEHIMHTNAEKMHRIHDSRKFI